MHAVVVYESMFGNTRRIAEEIAAGLADHGTVECLEVGDAPAAPEADVLVVGAPTHAFGLSRPSSREDAARMIDGPLVSGRRGVREWLETLAPSGGHAACFGTRVSGPLGSAAKAIDRRLRGRRRMLAAPEDFFVKARGVAPDQALCEGEPARARAWGEALGRRLAGTPVG